MRHAFKSAIAAASLSLAGACTTTTLTGHPGGKAHLAELNHVFAVVDPVTAEAIRESDFLRRFANLEIRTTTGTRSTWTGRYLYGKRTYIEFFGPGDFSLPSGPAPIGTWGIALSGDRRGTNATLAEALTLAGHKAFVEMDTRTFGDRTVPWFEALTAISEHGDSGALGAVVSVWAMEYQPSYFDLPEVAKEPPENPDDVISRERYQSDAYLTKMMRDVVHVHFDVGAEDFARIEPLLRSAGYRIARSGSEIRASGRESSFGFSLMASDRMRLRQVKFALNAPVKRHVEIIGRSRLEIGPGATADWTFDPPQ